MNAWSIKRYSRPRLAVDKVAIVKTGVVLERNGEKFDLDVTGAAPDRRIIAATLDRLCTPGADLWKEVTTEPLHPWAHVLEQLDALGLIQDDERDLPRLRQQEADTIASDARTAAQWLAASDAPAAPLQRQARWLRREAVAQLNGGQTRHIDTPDFYRDVLTRILRNWSRNAPISLAAAALCLDTYLNHSGAAAGSDALSSSALDQIRSLSGGLFEPRDIRVHLQTLCVLLLLCGTPAAQRRSRLPVSPKSVRSGINLMLEGERLATQSLCEMGFSAFQNNLNQRTIPWKLAAAIYIEQYHLSARFIEIITPLLHQRLRPRLKNLLYQYYQEEAGHELFEKEAALSLGVPVAQIDVSFPTPLFAAYLDVLTGFATENPVGLLLSVLVTEGFPGTHTPINEALQAAGLAPSSEAVRKHEQVNLDLHHSTIPRLLMAEIPTVSPAIQKEALTGLQTMVELNFRAWEMLLAYYSTDDLPFPHTWMSIPPQRVSSIFS